MHVRNNNGIHSSFRYILYNPYTSLGSGVIEKIKTFKGKNSDSVRTISCEKLHIIGLRNSGSLNVCFLNSVLQVQFSI